MRAAVVEKSSSSDCESAGVRSSRLQTLSAIGMRARLHIASFALSAISIPRVRFSNFASGRKAGDLLASMRARFHISSFSLSALSIPRVRFSNFASDRMAGELLPSMRSRGSSDS